MLPQCCHKFGRATVSRSYGQRGRAFPAELQTKLSGLLQKRNNVTFPQVRKGSSRVWRSLYINVQVGKKNVDIVVCRLDWDARDD